jgi:hypothetical protein
MNMKDVIGSGFASTTLPRMNPNDQELGPESLTVSEKPPEPLFGTHIRETVETIMSWMGRR